MQSLQGADLVKITHHVSQINDFTTCIECCKYYIAPETAYCGHTLCHTCWIGRRACPYCSKSVARRQLKLNRHMQSMTEGAQSLSETFQHLFNIKLDEVLIESAQPVPPPQHDLTKNVTDWLASSQNHFSALNTEEQSQELLQNPNPVNVSIDKIQIHSHTHTPNNPEKVVYIPVVQDDWDKIELLPNTEDVLKNKENVVGPMDIEPFDLDDSEYTAKHPRRSSRKRDPKPLADNVTKNINNSLEKQNSSNFSEENDKKSNKIKQTWNNVKKMRREFSKLNRKNRNKLNVSIEMCKKTQTSAKTNTAIPKVDSSQIYDIDEDTPVATIKKQTTRVLTEEQNINQETIQKQPKIYDKDEDTPVVEIIGKEKKRVLTEEQHINQETIHVQPNPFSNKSRSITNDEVHTVKQKNNKQETLRSSNNEAITDKGNNENKVTSQSFEHVLIQSQNNSLKMPFYKKSSLHPKCIEKKPDDVVTHTVLSNNSSNDDIEISIKVGNTITNILIKRKNDVELKVKTDREIQTSLGSHNITSNNEVIVNIGDNNKQGDLDYLTRNPRIEELTKAATSKTVSEKKNTDSADTASAQFEITESVEKELSKNMEYADNNQLTIKSKSSKCMKQKPTQKVSEPAIKENFDDYMNDLDIFDSESIKASGVKLLKNVGHAPSEIIPCTTKTKNRTQKLNNKRDRPHNNDENILPKSKQRKLNVESATNESIKLTKTKPNDPESEPMNYDVIMGTVFASIDADIEKNRLSQNNEATSDIRNKEINNISKTTQIDVKSKTVVNVSTPNEVQSIENPADDHFGNQKDSENIFSVCVDKDDINDEPVPAIEKEPPNVATSNIEEFLTPVMCRELQSTDVLMVENDDSDKSVVEETPQKSTSFSKIKAKSTGINKDMNQSQRIDKEDQKMFLEKARSKASSIVDSSSQDTTMESKKDATVIETIAQKALETPLTINKFAGDIKYKSTPAARKSLQFESENMDDLDPEQTLCPTNDVIGKTTQEKEFLRQVFEKSLSTTDLKPVSRKLALKHNTFCVAGTCLSSVENAKLKQLCLRHNWTYTTTFSKELTHLVVGVDEENRSQRSVKYMSALSSSKWIISFEWVEKCLQTGGVVGEEPYEALDSTGEPGPRRSRLAATKLFHGITFYCMGPFGVLDVDTLNSMLESSGGKVVKEVKEVRITSTSSSPALLLAEPEHTQEDRFIYLAMELNIVPVNYEWALNCLGSYTLGSIHELLLCPSTILPKAIHQWPQEMLARDDD